MEKITLLKRADATAIAGVNFEYSYDDLYRRALKFAETVGGKRTAIFSENSPEWAFALEGAWLSGASAVPIDAKSSPDELAFILSDSDAQILCVGRGNLETARAAISSLSCPPKIEVLEDIFYGDMPDLPEGDWKIERNGDDLALIVYTSGTTGNPKGVMLSFANMYANIKAVHEAKYYPYGVRAFALLPFHHILPLMGTLIAPLSVSGKIVIPNSINPDDISEAMRKHKVDIFISVPRFYELLHANIMNRIQASRVARLLFNIAKLANSRKFSEKLFAVVHKKFGGHVEYWVSGGAPLDKKVWRELDILGFGVREGYGMTECSPIITFPRIDNIRIGSTGQALPGVEIKISDGEIIVRGGNVTKGYYKRPEETAESIVGGWLHTGDLGYLDDDGFLFITGRKKEIIVLPNGKNLNPAEMEANIKKECADILEIGVLMREKLLQAVVRISPELVARLGFDGAEEHIRNCAILPYNRKTSPYKRIIKFVLTADELPRTRVGKLKRFALENFFSGSDSARNKIKTEPEPHSQTYAKLRDFISTQISVAPRPDAHMEMDLGLDSLGKISVQCFVRENFGIDVSERDFEDCKTLRKLSELVEKNADSEFHPSGKGITWADIIDEKPYPKIPKPNFLHFLSIDIFKSLSKLLYKVKISGLENVPQGPAIIAPNHQCYLDGLFVSQGFTKTQIYKTYFFAKVRSILKNGILRKYADKSNVIIMDIRQDVKSAIQKIAAALRGGNRVVIFPEGTRTSDGKIAEFKQTFAILAKELGAPVVPVAISGAYQALKPGATLPSFGAHISVTYLPVMFPNREETYEDFSKRVRGELQKAVGEA